MWMPFQPSQVCALGPGGRYSGRPSKEIRRAKLRVEVWPRLNLNPTKFAPKFPDQCSAGSRSRPKWSNIEGVEARTADSNYAIVQVTDDGFRIDLDRLP